MKTGPKPRANECGHADRKHYAVGRCLNCHRAWRRANDPEYAESHKALSRKSVAKVRKSRPDDIARQRAEYYSRHREEIKARDRRRPKCPVTPERRKALRLQSRYGISVEDFTILYELQSGACGICRVNGKRLCVDHDHESGLVRGLLCIGCNTAIANLADGELFESALQYLGRSK